MDDTQDPVTRVEDSAVKSTSNDDVTWRRPSDVDSDSRSKELAPGHSMIYSVEDAPPWYLCIFFGLQHFLTMVGGDLAVTVVLSQALCAGDDGQMQAKLFGTILFCSGLATFLQSTVGSRLPIVHITTLAFLTPALSLLDLPKWKCPSLQAITPECIIPGVTVTEAPTTTLDTMGDDTDEELWVPRILELQGAVIVASLFELMLGATGLVGFMMRYIGPITIAPTITLIGLSLLQFTINTCEKMWWIAILATVLVLFFSQYLQKIVVPFPFYDKKEHCKTIRLPLFASFPIILAIMLAWLVCGILTWSGALTENEDKWGFAARTDQNFTVLKEAAWARFPYPFQWGWPTFSLAGVLGMMTGALASTVESVGDYHACAKMAGAPPPPKHAVNRGIAIEGLSCFFTGIWGTGNASTSNSGNIAIIGITKVGSRRMVQYTAVIMMLFGIFSKFGAFFVSVPDPVMGGIFIVLFGTLSAVGLSNLQYVDMNSSRNILIVGFSIFFGLSVSNWVQGHQDHIDIGVDELNNIIRILLSTHMFVGGVIAFILDNTIRGTPEERGLTKWRKTDSATGSTKGITMDTYNLPWCMCCLRKISWLKYIPFCPAYGKKDEENP